MAQLLKLPQLTQRYGVAEVNVAGELAAVAVAQDGDVEKRERFLRGAVNFAGEQNRSSAGAEKRAAVGGELLQRVEEAFFGHHFQVRGAFAARQDHAGYVF